MKAFDSYGYESAAFEPEWDQYLGLLYPSDTNLQRMFNRRVLESLAREAM